LPCRSRDDQLVISRGLELSVPSVTVSVHFFFERLCFVWATQRFPDRRPVAV
jgi:hypothetical protein